MPKWGKNITLTEDAKQFIRLTREGFLEGDWSFVAQKTGGNYFTSPLRTSYLDKGCSKLRIADRCNIYITANAFSSNHGHKAQFLFAMHNLVADIDCHFSGISAAARDRQIQNLVHAVKHSFSDYSLLEPNFIVYTGRGVQFWWHHEGLSVRSNMWTWDSVARRLQVCLETILRDLGDDPMDGCPNLKFDAQASFNPAGLYRLPGTVNQSTGETVHYEVCSLHTYTLAELKEFRAEIPIVPKAFIPKGTKDTHAWARQMVDKVMALRMHRDAPIGEELRNNFCFVLHCLLRSAGYSKEYCRKQAAEFNQGFKVPLREAELRSSLSATAHKDYRLSTKAIIHILEITPAEQKALGIGYNLRKLAMAEKRKQVKKEKAWKQAEVVRLYQTGMNFKEISKRVGYNRNLIAKIVKQSGVTPHNVIRDREIVELKKQGWTIAQIVEKVGCSEPTVVRVTRHARKQGEFDIKETAEYEWAAEDSSFLMPACNREAICHTHNGCLIDRGGSYGPSSPLQSQPSSRGQSTLTTSNTKTQVALSPRWSSPAHQRLSPANGHRWTLRLDGWRDMQPRPKRRRKPKTNAAVTQSIPSPAAV